MMDAGLIQTLGDSVQAAAKYAAIDRGLVLALVEQELAKGRSPRDTVKAVRNKLHQVGSAYQETSINYAHLTNKLAELPRDIHDPRVMDFCRTSMQDHTSTRERLSFLDHFYSETLNGIGPIHSLIDLACGLNPLALAWLPLAEDVQISACDIYADMADFLNAFFSRTGVNGRAFTCDLIHSIPSEPVQLALLLKTIPCLEQVDKTIGRRLFSGIQADHLLVSFPVHSLGGRGKGMRVNYDQHFQELIAGMPFTVTRYDFSGELAFRLDRVA